MSRPELFYDLGSPYAYLAVERAELVLGTAPVLRPVLLGAIFAARGHGSWSQTPARADGIAEVERRAAAYGLPPVRWPTGWPPNTLKAMRAAVWAERHGRGGPFARAAFRRAFAAGSAWLGGLAGLLVLWGASRRGRRMRALALVVPRFSRVALGAAATVAATGTAQTIQHLPTLASLWQTGFGRAIAVKAGLLGMALVLGAVNLRVTTPRLAAAGARDDAVLAADGPPPSCAAPCRARSCSSDRSSSPPACSRACLRRRARSARSRTRSARVGPGPVSHVVDRGATRTVVRLTPDTAVAPMGYGVDLATRRGVPVTGANVVARFSMLDMDMGQQAYALREVGPGRYRRNGMPLIMVGNWGITFDVTPRRGAPYSFTLVDHANG